MNRKLLVIFIIAFLIRLISINQSLWLDEATTARVMQQYNFFEIVTKFSPYDFHPPLYYLFMKAWTNILGYSEIMLRMPSILFSLLTGYLVYLLGNKIDSGQARMTKKQTGILAAALFLFNPLVIYYSQEARMYMMGTFLLTLALYFLIRLCHPELVSGSVLIRSRNQFGMTKDNLLFNVYSILSFVTFYGSVFLIIPMFFYLLYKKKYKYFFVSCLVFSVTILILFPLLYQQITNAKQQLQLVPNWKQVLGNANLKNLFLIPLKFSIGRISFYPKWLYWGVSGIWTAFILFFIVKGGLRNKFLMFLIISSLGLATIFSLFTPLLQYFRFLYLIPIISILLAIGSSKFHRFGGIWVIATGFITLSLIYLLNPSFHREDWKNLTKSLPKKAEIYMIASSSDAIKYYRNDLKINDLKNMPKKINKKEIFVLPYTADIHGINYQKILENKKYRLTQKIAFRGVILEKWKY